MELWQMDVVGGVLLANGQECKVLTGIDDHSRFVVCAGVMERATSRAVCGHFAEAMRDHGLPQEVLTDNGKVFTGRFAAKDIEVLFDRICRENGIDHLLTAPRRPTTTGKIERFHRTLRSEFLTGRVFDDLQTAQADLDRWIESYNTERPPFRARDGLTNLRESAYDVLGPGAGGIASSPSPPMRAIGRVSASGTVTVLISLVLDSRLWLVRSQYPLIVWMPPPPTATMAEPTMIARIA
jgi:hypothetical protein